MSTVLATLPPNHVHLSPLHEVELSSTYGHYIQHPPDHDIVLFNLSKKMANNEPLIQGELVIAGQDTLEQYELARTYPLHFRKTYYPTSFHQDPAEELRHLNRASEILDIPPAIGSTRTTFRSCFVPGRPLDKLSPFGVEPPERNIEIAKEQVEPMVLIGLWKLYEELYRQVKKLHQGGLAHGDLYLHNAIVSMAPIKVCLIDFELAKHRDEITVEEWAKITAFDRQELFTQAAYVQCGLGRQAGELAEAVYEVLPDLFGRHAGRYRRAMDHAGSPHGMGGGKVRARK